MLARGRALLASYWTPAGRQAFGNLIGLVVCTAVSQGCALGLLVFTTRGLTPDGYGVVVFALNLQSYLFVLGTFGQGTTVVRALMQHPHQADQATTAFIGITGGVAMITAVVVAVAAAFVAGSPDERLMLWCVAAGNVAACFNLNPLFDAAHRQAVSAALALPGDLLAVGGAAWLHAERQLTVPAVGALVVGRWVLTAVLHAAVYHRTARRFRFAWDGSVVRPLVRAGWPLVVLQFVYLVPYQGTVVFARLFRSEADTAVYGLAMQFGSAVLLVGLLVTRVIQPHLMGPHGLERSFVVKLGVFVAGFGAVLWAGGVAGVWMITTHFLSASYAPVFGLSALTLTTAAVLTATMPLNYYLIRFHRERTLRTIYAVGAAVYLAVTWATASVVPLTVFTAVPLLVAVGLAAAVAVACVRAWPREME